MKINLNEIRQIFNNMLDRANELGITEIETNVDYYWIVTADDRTNFNTKVPNVCVGSLIDDYEELKKTLDGTNPHTALDFDRVANIIVEVGNEISSSDKPYF